DWNPEAPLQLDILAECLDARVGRQQKQVAVLVKIDGRADFVGESFQQLDRFEGELDVRAVRELVPHAAGIAAGGSRGQQLLALDQDDVGDAAACQVIRD